MKYKAFDYKELIDITFSSVKMVNLLSKKEDKLNLVFVDKGETIPNHHSMVDVCIFVVEGKIEVVFNRLDNCICKACECDYFDDNEVVERRYIVKENQLFFFDKNVVHSINALKKSYFLVIKI